MTQQVTKKERHVSLLAQIAMFFIIGVAFVGVLSSFALYSYSLRYVRNELNRNANRIADDLASYIRQYPAHDWLLRYWYENYDKLDIEYDVSFGADTQTAGKCREMAERHPGFLVEYADEKDIEALPPEDQKLYAEIVYSWLITRIDQIEADFETDYLMCIVTEKTFDTQFVLFIAAREGETRGTEPGQIFVIGKQYPASAEQQTVMREVVNGNPRGTFSKDGKYMDFYKYIGSVDDHYLLSVIARDTTKVRQEIYTKVVEFGERLLLFMSVLSVVCLIILYYVVLRPLKRIQGSINTYKTTKDSDEAVGSLSVIGSNNELAVLADDVADMTKEINAYTRDVERITSEKERVVTELALAGRIQSAMLPNQFPPYPDRHDFEIYASMTPAREIGGDFYNFILADENRLCLLIADVSGKGIPASLFMMASSITLSHYVKTGQSAAQVLADANNSICAQNPEEMFITVWLGILDLKTGRMICANAGHEYPMLMKPGQSFETIKDPHGIVIGAFEGVSYKEYELMMEPGSKLFVYTDGLPEATAVNEEMFGMERILAELNESREKDTKTILEDMRKAVNRFTIGNEPFDDLTMMCFEYKGPEGGGSLSDIPAGKEPTV